jgi:phenylpropionate dioxygenase-like ring-hydroxylating dioxygenase large terminal subunit
VPTYATCEKYGFVWLCPDPDGQRPGAGPLEVKEADDASYLTLTRRAEFPGGVHAVVENALDVPHTAVLHKGLFRSGEARREVGVEVRRHQRWVEAEFIGESPPGGLVARLLTLGSRASLKNLKLEHWDRFILPSVLQVEYRIGPRSHFLITGFCCPESDKSTRLFALVCLKTPLPQWLVRLLVRVIEPFAWEVVAQDVAILRGQTETIEHFGGERFMSTDIDVLGGAITRLMKDASDREQSGEGNAGHDSVDRQAEPRDVTKLKILV